MEPHTIPPLMLKEAAHSLTQAKFRRRAGAEGEARAHNTKLEQHDPFQKAGRAQMVRSSAVHYCPFFLRGASE